MRKIYAMLVPIFFIPLMAPTTQDKFLSFTKSIETFAAVLNEIDKNYITAVNIEEISNTAISSITKSLDNYTYVLSPNDSNYKSRLDTEIAYEIGIEISNVQSQRYISRIYKNSTAHKAGIQPGDEILKINGIDIASKTDIEVSNMLKNTNPSPVTLQIQRFGFKEAKIIIVNKEKVKSRNLVYFCILANNIAYIKLQYFGYGVAVEVKNVLQNLKSLGTTKIILDLRGNSGGIIEECIQVLEQFLEPDTLVAKSIGRNAEFNKEYRTSAPSGDTAAPIVTIVDDQTASAAEIFAGALQDLDRAVVIGVPTYGKGTIQTIKELPYNTKIKITTAKYILPSGRGISVFTNKDSAKPYKPKQFKTKNGRTLYEKQGITPDLIIKPRVHPHLINQIVDLGCIQNYSAVYRAKYKEIDKPEIFSLSDSQYQDFINWMRASSALLTSEKNIYDLILAANDIGYGDSIKKQLTTTLSQVIRTRQEKLLQYKKELKPILEATIAEQYYMYEGGLEASFKTDNYLQPAVSLLINNDQYLKLLTTDIHKQ